jgi:hypothetical protein
VPIVSGGGADLLIRARAIGLEAHADRPVNDRCLIVLGADGTSDAISVEVTERGGIDAKRS